MENIFPSHLIDILTISITLSFVIMVMLQKLKTLSFINKSWHIWFLNLLFSFAIGIPFAISFYKLNLYDGIWVSLFTFIGAPALFDTLKNQTIINFKPTTLSDTVEVSKDNVITR